MKEENNFSLLKLFFGHYFGERSIDQPARAACTIRTLNVLSYNSKTLSLGHERKPTFQVFGSVFSALICSYSPSP